uniref:Uncharacterized protein n=1 Tax=Caenorhabditis tropicalis TaxID=1561998 RepID=A0A1I7UNG4_9PELO
MHAINQTINTRTLIIKQSDHYCAEKECKKDEDTIGTVQKKQAFSIEQANEFDVEIELPNLKFFRISQIVRREILPQCASSDMNSSIRSFLRNVFDEIHNIDMDFPTYSTSKKRNCTCQSVSNSFMALRVSITSPKYAAAGFGKRQTPEVISVFAETVREVLHNKLSALLIDQWELSIDTTSSSKEKTSADLVELTQGETIESEKNVPDDNLEEQNQLFTVNENDPTLQSNNIIGSEYKRMRVNQDT